VYTKWVTRNGKWKRVVQYKSKEKRTNNTNYTENYRLNNTNPTNSWLDMILLKTTDKTKRTPQIHGLT
jgi:hypothetical protein